MRHGARRSLGSMLVLLAGSAVIGAVSQPQPARAAITPGCVVDMSGAIGWWRGEDDLVGETGPPGTGAISFADAEVGRGMSFDGTTAVTVPGLPAPSVAVSVEAWVKPVDNGLMQAVLTRWDFPSTDDSARAYTLLLAPGGRLLWSTDETSTRRPLELAADAPQLFDGSFHHLAATWSNTESRVYVDGVQVATTASQGGTLNPAATTDVLIGGSHGLGSPLVFSGIIDEPTVWSRALSETEVAAIHGAGVSGKCNFVPLQLERVVAGAPASNSWFGQAVAIKGTTFVAGSSAANIFAGTADVYIRSGSFWFHQATLVAGDRHVTDFFGAAVAVDGDTIVVGTPGSSPLASDSGAVYVFTRTGSTWTQQAKIFPPDGSAIDQFGSSVDIDGDTLVVGSWFDDDAGTDSGSTYVYTRSGATWTQQAKIVPGDAAAGDTFGFSVAVKGDTLIAGSPGNDEIATTAGAAYVFTRTGSTWMQETKLTVPGALAGDEFGRAVDLDTDRAAVGAPYALGSSVSSGAVHVYQRTGGVWSEEALLTSQDGATGDEFGWSVSLTPVRAVIGARGKAAPAPEAGAAYVFSRSGSTWSELAELTADDGAEGDQLGSTVAVSGSNYVIGAPNDDDFGNNSGAVYLFVG